MFQLSDDLKTCLEKQNAVDLETAPILADYYALTHKTSFNKVEFGDATDKKRQTIKTNLEMPSDSKVKTECQTGFSDL